MRKEIKEYEQVSIRCPKCLVYNHLGSKIYQLIYEQVKTRSKQHISSDLSRLMKYIQALMAFQVVPFSYERLAWEVTLTFVSCH